uniref:Carbonic anhydrase 15-like n=1 Tax=Cyanistes caeruleus TaxID=156563 RepID=A0A8C0U3E2_CYACU
MQVRASRCCAKHIGIFLDERGSAPLKYSLSARGKQNLCSVSGENPRTAGPLLHTLQRMLASLGCFDPLSTHPTKVPIGPEGLYWERLTQGLAIPSWLEGPIAGYPASRVLAGGSCARLTPLCFPQMHIVHMNAKYQTLAEAKGHPNGLAVLGFFFQVSETTNTNYNTMVAGLRNVSHAGDSVDLASTFRLSTLLPRAGRLSGYYRYQGSLTTPDCSEAVIWTVFEEPVEIGREQLKAFVSTLHFPLEGSVLLKMINNFRPPQPLHSRKIFASRGATASGGSLHRGHQQLLSPLLLLTLLSLFSPAP